MLEDNMTESVNQISDAWTTVNWPQVQRTVFRLQQRIYRASQRGDTPGLLANLPLTWGRGRRGVV